MNNLKRGISYSFNRNIGTVDRTIRTIVGIAAFIGAFYFYSSNLLFTILLGVLAFAQFGTVFSARCIICYFTKQCTIPSSEKKKLEAKGIKYEQIN
ncbi:DUF2892 domain-containing protein [uncultured Aquimarina sp.]|uniref:YgaP family membrane protein n=1 Tax=uncultured Aquimarina sp. TaxID=575652 RepID=UPI00343FD519